MKKRNVSYASKDVKNSNRDIVNNKLGMSLNSRSKDETDKEKM